MAYWAKHHGEPQPRGETAVYKALGFAGFEGCLRVVACELFPDPVLMEVSRVQVERAVRESR